MVPFELNLGWDVSPKNWNKRHRNTNDDLSANVTYSLHIWIYLLLKILKSI